MLKEAVRVADEKQKATVFGYWVNDPERYGVAEFDKRVIVFPLKKSRKCLKAIMPLLDFIFILIRL